MLVDASLLANRTTVNADVCVVGSGPSGITLARELGGAGWSVCVLESGGFGVDPSAQALSEGEAQSRHHAPEALSLGRRRQFGGTANLWIHRTVPWDRRLRARMLPARAIDLEERPGLPGTGWPLQRADLDPYYERAQAACQLGPFRYDPEDWPLPGAEPFPVSGPITNTVCQYAARDVFTHRARDDLAHAVGVTVYVHTSAVSLLPNASGSGVGSLQAITSAGGNLTVRASVFVLAGGAIENARLLLVSQGTDGLALGNRHGNVGRYLCDHPEFRLGVIVPPSSDLFDHAGFYDLRWAATTMVSGTLALSEEVMRAESLLSMGLILIPQPAGYGSRAERAIKELKSVRRGNLPERPLRHLGRTVVDLKDTLAVVRARMLRRREAYSEFRGGWSGLTDNHARFRVFEVIAATEQLPQPENRVSLAQSRDALGMPRMTMRWRWGETEQRSIDRARALLAEELGRAALGELVPWTDLEGPARPVFGGIHHPMGTTRLHPSPAFGVVDENCRVHGLANLFVAGSSVFPTGLGHANPTLTLLALAIRLSDHLVSTGV